MKKLALLLVVMALAVSGLAVAQAKPDFSGKWAPKDAGAGGPMAGPMTVKQAGNELTTERSFNDQTMTSVYKLDGTESTNKTMRGESKSTAKLEGGKLVIKTKSEGPNGPMETTQTWTLSADGKELTILNVSSRGERTTTYTKQ